MVPSGILFGWPGFGDPVAFPLTGIREDAILHEGDEAGILAIGEFELEFDRTAPVFVEQDDFIVIEIRPVGFAKERDDFFFGGPSGERNDLILNEEAAPEVLECDKSVAENSFVTSQFVATFFESKYFILKQGLGEKIAVPGRPADGSSADDEG